LHRLPIAEYSPDQARHVCAGDGLVAGFLFHLQRDFLAFCPIRLEAGHIDALRIGNRFIGSRRRAAWRLSR